MAEIQVLWRLTWLMAFLLGHLQDVAGLGSCVSKFCTCSQGDSDAPSQTWDCSGALARQANFTLPVPFGSAVRQNIGKIILTSNNLTSFKKGDFPDTLNLFALEARNNLISYIQPGTFRNLTQLTRLDLSGNQLTGLQRVAFEGLGNLRTLILSDNPLVSLAPGVFNVMSRLRHVELNSCKLTSLSANLLRLMPSLEDLYVVNNSLPTLDLGLFAGGMPRRIRADHNQIASVTIGGLSQEQVAGFILVSLQNNQLSTLPLVLSANLSSSPPSAVFEAANNPWNCACTEEFLALRSLLALTMHTSPALCSRPVVLAGMVVSSIAVAAEAVRTQCACQTNCTASPSEGCDPRTLKCACHINAVGDDCDFCQARFYNNVSVPGCQACGCSVAGSRFLICNARTGDCHCRPGRIGRTCNECAKSYYLDASATCVSCSCDPAGSAGSVDCANITGQCPCVSGYKGRACNQCTAAHFRVFPTEEGGLQHDTCVACNCTTRGSTSLQCGTRGDCTCKSKATMGVKCDTCAAGYYSQDTGRSSLARFGSLAAFLAGQYDPSLCTGATPSSDLCQECCCNLLSSVNTSCSDSGQCYCHLGYAGPTCDQCAAGYSAYTTSNGTECVSDAVLSAFLTCSRSFDPILGVYWPMTKAGIKSTVSCPQGFAGDMTRNCSIAGIWQKPNIDACVSSGFTVVLQQIGHLTSKNTSQTQADRHLMAASALSMLSTATANGSAALSYLAPGDLQVATDTLQTLTQQQYIPTDDSVQGNYSQSYVQTVSNLLESRNIPSWGSTKDAAATTLLGATSEFAFYTAQNTSFSSSGGNQVNYVEPNVALSLSLQSAANPHDIIFPDYSNQALTKFSQTSDKSMSSIKVPAAVLQKIRQQTGRDKIPVANVIFNNLDLIYPSTYQSQSNDPFADPVLNTAVITTRVGVLDLDTTGFTDDPITITLVHRNRSIIDSLACVFWNSSLRGEGDTLGAWDTAGVTRVSRDDGDTGTTVCQSTHLTSFAVLVSPTGYSDAKHDVVLSYITYIGCAISLACLVAMVVVLFTLRKADLKTSSARHSQNIIHLNLAVALALGQITFIAGINQTQHRAACGTVAGLLQYFYTVAFAWMGVEGYHLYLMTEHVFKSRENRLKLYFTLAWGLPLINVGVAAGIRHEFYGTKDYCWLSIDNGTIWAFLGPVCAIVLFNLFVFCNTLRILLSRVKEGEHTKAVKAGLRATGLLLPLLGLTWIFGLLAVNKGTILFAYLFTIFNSLQGAFLFLLHIALNKKVRESYGSTVKKSSLYKLTSRSSISPEPRKGSTGSTPDSGDLQSTARQSVASLALSLSDAEKSQEYLPLKGISPVSSVA